VTTTLVSPSTNAPDADDLDDVRDGGTTGTDLELAPETVDAEIIERGATGTDLELAPETVDAEIIDAEIVDDGPVDLPVGAPMPPSVRMELLDPRQLWDNPRNPRRDVGDLSDLTASMRVVGVLEPLVVFPYVPEDATVISTGDGAVVADQQFMIFIGHRRKYAAIEVGLEQVPCWVVSDRDAVQQILGQMLENTHRVGLTVSEEAEAYHQLTLLDWTPEQIGQVRAIPATKVRKALQVRSLPETVKKAVDDGVLGIDEGRALEQFQDTPAVHAKLVREIGNQWRFRHALAAAQQSRAFAQAKEMAKAKLVVAGVKVTSKPKQFGYNSPEVDVRHLADADGKPLDPETAKTLPGFAAFIERNGTQATAVVYCKDPEQYGYTKPQPRHSWLTPEQAAAREAEERAKAAQREQLATAISVRRDFIRATWGTARAARGLYVAALRADLLGHDLERSDELGELYTALGGAERDSLATAGEDKLRRSLVARWLCALESNLEIAADEHPYYFDKQRAVDFYDLLMAAEYPLTDAETSHYELLTREPAVPADPDEDPDTDEQDDEEKQAEQVEAEPGHQDPDGGEAASGEPAAEPVPGGEAAPPAGDDTVATEPNDNTDGNADPEAVDGEHDDSEADDLTPTPVLA